MGEPISSDTLDDAAAHVLQAAKRLPRAPPSFFEATTALALDVFRNARIDVAVLEVGLGGRLDATNVVDAKAAVITSVDFDHEEYLGHTLEAIAAEKAGVIKPGAVVVLATNPAAVERVVERASMDSRARLVRARDGVSADVRLVDGSRDIDLTTPAGLYGTLRPALAGRHQADNAITSVRLLESLRSELGFDIPAGAIATGVEDVLWPARLETVTVSSIDVLLDGAHNPAGARALSAHSWTRIAGRCRVVVGVMRDKAIEPLLSALSPAASHFIFTAASTPRAAAPAALSTASARVAPGVPAFIEPEPFRAVSMAAAFGSPVVVAGSLYLAEKFAPHGRDTLRRFTPCAPADRRGGVMFRFVLVLAVTTAGLIGPRAAAAQDGMLGSCKSTIRPQGQTPEPITDRPAPPGALRFTFVGTPVVITCDDMVLQAQTIIYETDTQDIRATGEVLLQQRDLRVFAERAEMNSRTKLGVFYEANGIARIGDAPAEKNPFGTLESDVMFHGRRLEKAGPRTYKINHGAFTTCAQPVPRWEMTMGNGTITIDERAILRNVVLRVKDVPLLYLPAFYYPMNKEDRSTGFLLPTYGASNLRGSTLSNAFFWAISRSQDATFFHD